MCCVVVYDLETSRMGAPYIYDISHLRVNLPDSVTNEVWIIFLSTEIYGTLVLLLVRRVNSRVGYTLLQWGDHSYRMEYLLRYNVDKRYN